MAKFKFRTCEWYCAYREAGGGRLDMRFGWAFSYAGRTPTIAINWIDYPYRLVDARGINWVRWTIDNSELVARPDVFIGPFTVSGKNFLPQPGELDATQ